MGYYRTHEFILTQLNLWIGVLSKMEKTIKTDGDYNIYNLKNMDTNNIKNLEIVRSFLSSFRDENFNQFGYNTKLKNQAVSNTISLLADKIKLISSKNGGE